MKIVPFLRWIMFSAVLGAIATEVCAASFEKTQSSGTSELKSSSSGFSNTQSTQPSQVNTLTSTGIDLGEVKVGQPTPAQISQEPPLNYEQPEPAFNQQKTPSLSTKAQYDDISMKQSISGTEHTVKSGDTEYLKKHLIQSTEDKIRQRTAAEEREEQEKYLSYDNEDIVEHYKERKEEDVEYIYK